VVESAHAMCMRGRARGERVGGCSEAEGTIMRVEQPRSTWLADDSRLITRSLRASDTRSLSARASSHWSTPVCFSHAWLSAHHQRRRAASQLSRTSIAAQAASVTPLFAPRCLHE
jgi:hypothetical protein